MLRTAGKSPTAPVRNLHVYPCVCLRLRPHARPPTSQMPHRLYLYTAARTHTHTYTHTFRDWVDPAELEESEVNSESSNDSTSHLSQRVV